MKRHYSTIIQPSVLSAKNIFFPPVKYSESDHLSSCCLYQGVQPLNRIVMTCQVYSASGKRTWLCRGADGCMHSDMQKAPIRSANVTSNHSVWTFILIAVCRRHELRSRTQLLKHFIWAYINVLKHYMYFQLAGPSGSHLTPKYLWASDSIRTFRCSGAIVKCWNLRTDVRDWIWGLYLLLAGKELLWIRRIDSEHPFAQYLLSFTWGPDSVQQSTNCVVSA